MSDNYEKSVRIHNHTPVFQICCKTDLSPTNCNKIEVCNKTRKLTDEADSPSGKELIIPIKIVENCRSFNSPSYGLNTCNTDEGDAQEKSDIAPIFDAQHMKVEILESHRNEIRRLQHKQK